MRFFSVETHILLKGVKRKERVLQHLIKRDDDVEEKSIEQQQCIQSSSVVVTDDDDDDIINKMNTINSL